VSLPLYGREANEVKKQILLKTALENKTQDIEQRQLSRLAGFYYQIKEDKHTYETLRHRVMPKIKTMIRLEKSAYQNGGKMNILVDKLISLLDIRTRQINLLARMGVNDANINQLIGK